ncbi:MAG TPA: hypothetical protein VF360_06435, partial [Candidatus Methanoperedens sp.]
RQDQQDLQDLPQKSYPVDPVNPVKGHDLLDTTFKSIFVQQQEKKRSQQTKSYLSNECQSITVRKMTNNVVEEK